MTAVPQLVVAIDPQYEPWYGDGCPEVYSLAESDYGFNTLKSTADKRGYYLLYYYVENPYMDGSIPTAAYTQIIRIDDAHVMSFVGDPQAVPSTQPHYMDVAITREGNNYLIAPSVGYRASQTPMVNPARTFIARVSAGGYQTRQRNQVSSPVPGVLYIERLGPVGNGIGVTSAFFAPASVPGHNGDVLTPVYAMWIDNTYMAVLATNGHTLFGVMYNASSNSFVPNFNTSTVSTNDYVWADFAAQGSSITSTSALRMKGGAPADTASAVVAIYQSGSNQPNALIEWDSVPDNVTRLGTVGYNSTSPYAPGSSNTYITSTLGSAYGGHSVATGAQEAAFRIESDNSTTTIAYQGDFNATAVVSGFIPAGYQAGGSESFSNASICDPTDATQKVAWFALFSTATTSYDPNTNYVSRLPTTMLLASAGFDHDRGYVGRDNLGPFDLTCTSVAGAGLMNVGVHTSCDDVSWVSGCNVTLYDANYYNAIAVCGVRSGAQPQPIIVSGWHMGLLGWGGQITA